MREEWKEVEISSFAKVMGGGTPSTKEELFWNGEIPWITPYDLSNHTSKYIEKGSRNITDLGLKKSSAKLHPKNTILLTSRAPIGYLAIAKNEISTNQGFQSLICDENLVCPNFIYYSLKVNMDKIKGVASGATFPEVSGKKVGKIKINLPPLPTQQRIASILSAYDDLIENNLKRIKILEEMAQQTYEEWFVRMRFPGYENAVIDDETGLPEGWEKVKCFDAMEVLSGGTPKTEIDEYWNGTIEFYTPKDARSGSYTDGTEKTITEIGLKKCNSKLYPKDTVFITARGTVGKINLASKPMAMNQSCYALKGKKHVSQYFLFCSMISIIETFKSASNGGVFNTIIVDTFKFLDYVLPNEDLIIKFENMVNPIFNSIHNLQSQNQRLRESRDILLPRLMMGMIV
ncbi:MAG: restriction endonuclease subunit S [Chitinophagales bacterium]|nr:restriction endonuclease subunit S [Chitinophagales bacterium]